MSLGGWDGMGGSEPTREALLAAAREAGYLWSSDGGLWRDVLTPTGEVTTDIHPDGSFEVIWERCPTPSGAVAGGFAVPSDFDRNAPWSGPLLPPAEGWRARFRDWSGPLRWWVRRWVRRLRR